MPSIPAICEDCGKQFHSGRSISKGVKFISIGGRADNCPYCGGMGHIDNGLYEYIDDVLEGVYKEDVLTLFRLKDILEKSNTNNIEHEIMLMQEELKKSNNLQEEHNDGLKEILNKVNSLEEKLERDKQFKLIKVILGIAIPILLSLGDSSMDEFKNYTIEKFIELVTITKE